MSEEVTLAFIGLGSNLADPVAQLRRALDGIAALDGTVTEACSSFYRSPPMGPPAQPDYVNAVARVATSLTARALLDGLQAIERRQGRVRGGERWGPRTIDLDILLFGERVIDERGLTVPHPGIAERAFVLVPLAELAPDLRIPGAGPVGRLLEHVDAGGVERLPG